MTPARFEAMVAAAGQTGAAPSEQGSGSPSETATSSDATNTPSVIQINGDNPATIDVGATYNDLGATITGPTPELNLGIQAIVDGGATTTLADITIDTSQPATHTIEYVATDQNGLEGTATRTIIVAAPPANDDGTTTDTSAATSTSS